MILKDLQETQHGYIVPNPNRNHKKYEKLKSTQ
jgi:hypothetical protein